MQNINILSRRRFLDRSLKVGLGAALASLVDIPFVMKRALAEGNIGLNGKKLLFIFLRGANDGLNSVIPILDPAYNTTNRPNILIPTDSLTDYSTTGPCDFPINSTASAPTFSYANAIRLGNGFAGLHPSLKFLAPVYNAGDLALIHRVGYPKQSRSHFDSQNYWENGSPNNNIVKDGIFYRTMVESGLANTNALTGVSIQSSLPLLLRGSQAAMTNLTDPTRYNLLGVPNTAAGNTKADNALRASNLYPFPEKMSRDLLDLQYKNMSDTLSIFASINFSETGNTFRDDVATDGDSAWANAGTGGYFLFPTSNAKNGGWDRGGGTLDPAKYVVDTGAYGFFNNLKAASIILNSTDAIIAGTEIGGFDTHNNQGGITGAHANLQRRIGWAMYAVKKFFTRYGKGGPDELPGAKVNWNDLIVITLSEFGRTTVQNSNLGTDHAEAGAMFVAGGAVKGFDKGFNPSGVFGCHPGDAIPWATGQTGSMFGVSNRYLKRAYDYRSVLGKLIRDHLGATQDQVNRIIPGYADTREKLLTGGLNTKDNTQTMGEPNIV